MTTVESTAPAPDPIGARFRVAVLATMLAMFVAVPTALGWTAGAIVRAAALFSAAITEAYETGRGPRE